MIPAVAQRAVPGDHQSSTGMTSAPTTLTSGKLPPEWRAAGQPHSAGTFSKLSSSRPDRPTRNRSVHHSPQATKKGLHVRSTLFQPNPPVAFHDSCGVGNNRPSKFSTLSDLRRIFQSRKSARILKTSQDRHSAVQSSQ